MGYLLHVCMLIGLIIFFKTFNWSDILHGSNSFFMRSVAYAVVAGIIYCSLCVLSPVIIIIIAVFSENIISGIATSIVLLAVATPIIIFLVKWIRKTIKGINGDIEIEDIERTNKEKDKEEKKNNKKHIEHKTDENGYAIFDDEE